jgi:hypothetical protein
MTKETWDQPVTPARAEEMQSRHLHDMIWNAEPAERVAKVSASNHSYQNWLKFKKPDASAVRRKAEEEWGR